MEFQEKLLLRFTDLYNWLLNHYCRFGDKWGNLHGLDANGGVCQSNKKWGIGVCVSHKIDLEKGDSMNKIDLLYTPGKTINAIQIFTTMGHKYGPFGGDRGTSHSLDHPGCKLSYLSGKNYVETKHQIPSLGSLTFHFLCYGKMHNF